MVDKLKYVSVLFLVGFLFMSMISVANAGTQQTQKVPDVLVMVLSGLTSADQISFTYNAPVDKAAVKKDLETLIGLTGWQPQQLTVSTQGNPKTTSVEFWTPRMVNWTAGTFPVEPFIITFKRFNFVQVQYILQGTFPFRALRNYGDKYVNITWTPGEGNSAHGYSIMIKDRSFEKLNLPIAVDAADEAKSGKDSNKNGGGINMFAVLLIALLVGVVVFVIVSRVTQNRKE